MKRFECTVTREDKYIVEIDETIIDEEFMEEYRQSFYYLYTLKDHAGNLAQLRARFAQPFMEGYGVIKENGMVPFGYRNNTPDFQQYPINIKIISEDEDYDVDVREIK